MPIIEMHLMEGRTAELKRNVAVAVTEAVARTLACNPESVRILITEHGATEFFVAGRTMDQGAGRPHPASIQEETE